MGNEVANTGNFSVPAHLQHGKTARIGNIDETDVQIPRVKLLQAISPEVETYNEAKNGVFWHTTASQALGTDLAFIPILVRKTYVLWAPRNDPRGVLARANDGINWDVKDVFMVKPKGAPGEVMWDTTSGTVAGSKLDMFGTSIPGTTKSAPAASLTYQILAYFTDHPDLSPAIILNTRSAIKPAKDLFGKINLRQVDHYGQKYRMLVTKEQGAEGPYNNYRYVADGYANEVEYNLCKDMFDRYSQIQFRASDEGEESSEAGATSSKF